jgi:RNA polymerase sigma factor (sigma-70 family)
VSSVADLLRELAPQVLGVLVRRAGDFAAAEDAVQDALISAAEQWPARGLPDSPRAWLIHVAERRLTDQRRSESARRRREQRHAGEEELLQEPAADGGDAESQRDDTLLLLFMCCHPALTPASSIALTLRAVGGLTTAQIAGAFFVPEATMAQRISRAKAGIKASGVPFRMPEARERPQLMAAVKHVLYLIYNEGYTTSDGPELQRPDLAGEAIRLAREVHARSPDDTEVAGLLALMLLTDARKRERTGPSGELIPLDAQDRSLWDRAAIAEGVALISSTLGRGEVGSYQLQAAIAALHDEAPSTKDTDWPQILALYGVLESLSDNPMVKLSRAIAEAMVHGPRAGLASLATLASDPRLAAHHRLAAVRAHLLEMAGEREQAVAEYQRAAALTASLPEQHYLTAHAARLREGA